MVRPAHHFLLFFILSSVLGCGSVTETTNPPPAPSANPAPAPIPTTDPNNPQGNSAFLLTSDFKTIGTYSTLSLLPTRQANSNLGTTHTDAVVRSFGNLLYIINRKGQDNIQVVDPAQNFKTISQYSVGKATNPHDIFVLSPITAYVTLYEPEANSSSFPVDDLLILNPTTGEIRQRIDLQPYTDLMGDHLPRADRLLFINNKLYVTIQDLSPDFKPKTNGKVVVIDTITNSVERVIPLQGRNPFTMKYSTVQKLIYLPLADFTDTNSPYGGIEIVDPVTFSSKGIIIDDRDLGGAPGDLELNNSFGFVTIGFTDQAGSFQTKVVRFNPDPAGPANLQTVYTSKAYVPEIALLGDDMLLVGDADPAVSGILIFNPLDLSKIDGPISVGAPPVDITFFNR
ncbi:MAG: hypothetical protein Q7S98_05695 [Deltaproteobacteria bacterium]|nr:hypothetical protein [Deltaproteobacteria bacterium]